MPWRYILLLSIGVLLLFFLGFNFGNQAVLSLGFMEIQSNVALVTLGSFLLGGLTGIPFILLSMQAWKNRTKKKVEKKTEEKVKKQITKEIAQDAKEGKKS
jgi:uncharacterized integral membrane protein